MRPSCATTFPCAESTPRTRNGRPSRTNQRSFLLLPSGRPGRGRGDGLDPRPRGGSRLGTNDLVASARRHGAATAERPGNAVTACAGVALLGKWDALIGAGPGYSRTTFDDNAPGAGQPTFAPWCSSAASGAFGLVTTGRGCIGLHGDAARGRRGSLGEDRALLVSWRLGNGTERRVLFCPSRATYEHQPHSHQRPVHVTSIRSPPRDAEKDKTEARGAPGTGPPSTARSPGY
jgi:hypothetical protein